MKPDIKKEKSQADTQVKSRQGQSAGRENQAFAPSTDAGGSLAGGKYGEEKAAEIKNDCERSGASIGRATKQGR